MKDYSSDKIRNAGFFGHGGCGKTTLCETLLYLMKQNTRIGRVDEGNALLDYDEDEISRKTSINLALGFGEHRDSLLNLVDTPGYADFIGDVYSGVRAIDSAVVVVDSGSGVEVGTEMVWKLIDKQNLPRIILLTKLQREHADFDKTLDEVQKKFGIKVVALGLPIGSELQFKGVVDLLSGKAFIYDETQAKEAPVPTDMAYQLLATLALLVGTVYILKHSRRQIYALITFVPALFMLVTTVWAGMANVWDNYLPKHTFQGNLNAILSVAMIFLVIVIFIEALRRIAQLRQA